MNLFAKLPYNEVPQLKKLITAAKLRGSIRIDDLLKDFKQNGSQSIYFPAMSSFFTYLFGNYNQTTMIGNDLWIGNGINLTENPSVLALFYEMDPNVDWKNILKLPNQPVPGLSQSQINQLLCLSLTGVSNSIGTFDGYLPLLNNCLKDFSYHAFSVNQLVGFTTLICLKNGIVPDNLKNATDIMLETENDLPSLEIIIDYSNKDYNVATQNQLLRVASMFHGHNEASDLDVYLTQRQSERMLFTNPNNITIQNGPIKHGIPVGNDQESFFSGYHNITVFSSLNPKGINDQIIFGTPMPDVFSVISSGSNGLGVASYGGNSADTFNLDFSCFFSPNQPAFAFLAGNEGVDIYNLYGLLTSCGVRVTIYDSDHQGKVFTGFYNFEPSYVTALSAPIVDGKFNPTTLDAPISYDASFIRENDNSTTLQLNALNSQAILKIQSYVPGQFGIWPNANTHVLATFGLIVSSGVTPKGNIAICPYNNPYAHIYNVDGDLLKKVQLLPNGVQWSSIFVDGANDGKFHALGSPLMSGRNLTYTIFDLTDGIQNQTVIDTNIYQRSYQLTPTNSSNMEFASIYLKQDDALTSNNTYGMYVYIPSQGLLRVDTVNAEYVDSPDFGVYAGPTDKGFLINSLRTVNTFSDPCQSAVLELDSQGNVIRNETMNGFIFQISPLKGGYFQVYAEDQMQYSRSYRNGNWSQTYSLGNYYGCRLAPTFWGPMLQRLNSDMTLYMDRGGDYIFNEKNEIVMGGFGLGNDAGQNVMSWQASTLLPDGNTLLSYVRSAIWPNNVVNVALVVPTSYLNKEEKTLPNSNKHSSQKRQTVRRLMNIVSDDSPKIGSDNQLALVNVGLNRENYSFDYGNWDDDLIKQDPETNHPIFTYCVYRDKKVVGSLEFYGQRFLCKTLDGKSHNIINMTGELKDFKIPREMKIEKICQVLPKNLFDSVLLSAQEAAKHGALVGTSNVIGYTLQSTGISKEMSSYLNQLIYYAGYFSLRFNVYAQQLENQADIADYSIPFYQALTDTTNICLLRTGINVLTTLLNKASDSLIKHKWSMLGYATNKTSSLLKFGLFAYNAKEQGLAQTSAALVSGAVTQTFVEQTGTFIADKIITRMKR